MTGSKGVEEEVGITDTHPHQAGHTCNPGRRTESSRPAWVTCLSWVRATTKIMNNEKVQLGLLETSDFKNVNNYEETKY